jgi:hypothetical protein
MAAFVAAEQQGADGGASSRLLSGCESPPTRLDVHIAFLSPGRWDEIDAIRCTPEPHG